MDGEARPFLLLLSVLLLVLSMPVTLCSGKSRLLWVREEARSLRVCASRAWIRRPVGVAGAVLGGEISCEEVVSSGKTFVLGRSRVVDDMVRSNDRVKKG